MIFHLEKLKPGVEESLPESLGMSVQEEKFLLIAELNLLSKNVNGSKRRWPRTHLIGC